MFVGSFQIIRRLDSQSKYQIFTLFSGRHVGGTKHGGSILGSVNLRKTFRRISKVWEHTEAQSSEICLVLSPITLQFLDFIH